MRYIEKNDEPSFVAQYRKKYSKVPAGENNYEKLEPDEHKTLREYLLREQFFLCCYCMIAVREDRSHVEHIKPQSKYSKEALNYDNLLVSCNSKENCGHKKGNWWNEKEFISPLNEKCADFFQYSSGGDVIPLSETAEKTIKILNLNTYRLTQARKAAIATLDYLSGENIDDARTFLKFYSEPDEEGRLQNFAPVLVFFLERLLRR